jgi:hypothetical protein
VNLDATILFAQGRFCTGQARADLASGRSRGESAAAILRRSSIPSSTVSRPVSDVERLSRTLAGDPTITDYAIWRALKTIENDLYVLERTGRPIPIDLLYSRRILAGARGRRSLAM